MFSIFKEYFLNRCWKKVVNFILDSSYRVRDAIIIIQILTNFKLAFTVFVTDTYFDVDSSYLLRTRNS